MDPREALSRIEQIAEQLARSESYRGYRSASIAATALVGFAGGAVQARWHLNDGASFEVLWVGAALLCGLITVADMVVRYSRNRCGLQRSAMLLAARQFFPCVVAGALLTLALWGSSLQVLLLLPGLWAIVFALGIFASLPGLPRAAVAVAAYYLLAGLLALAWSRQQREFSPWTMPLIFGIGQCLAAALLYVSAERRNGPDETDQRTR